MSTSRMHTIEKALTAAGEVLMRHYGKLRDIEQKADINLVTVADREAEEVVKRIIRESFPDDSILAEESGAEARGEVRWIIDPLDGTTNFAHSTPIFATSIAVEYKGEVVAAGVENPFYQERFLASKGEGATRNGSAIRVSSAPSLSKSLVATGFPYDRREHLDHLLGYWREFLQRAHGILRLGSASLDLCWVACGRYDGYWEERLYPWDTAAGSLIVTEAGGKMSNFHGEPFSHMNRQTLATNGRIHDECLAVLKPTAPADGPRL
ncbi:MAG: inositol monophosphatase family protein [Polyangiaceae bacterium]